MIVEFLALIGVFLFIAGVFCLQYFIGEKLFWGNKYIKKGFHPLLSHRVDGYVSDTMGICFIIIYLITIPNMIRSDQLAAVWGTWEWVLEVLALPLGSFFLFSMSYALRKIFACYNEQGLFVFKPLSRMRSIPWNQIKEIRPYKHYYEVLSVQDEVLVRFFLLKKYVSFLDYAELRGVSIKGAKADRMLYHSSTKNTLQPEWTHAIAQSPYAKNHISAYGVFRDFIVVLFMDKKLNENNIIAINSDGSTRWTISEIIMHPKSVPYVSMSVESPETISVLSVSDRQYHGVISTINVYTCKVVHQVDRSER